MPNNGVVERFNGGISSEVLNIKLYSHRAPEQLLRGFNQAYNARRQRVLHGRTPNQATAEHLTANLNSPTMRHTAAQDHAASPKRASSLTPRTRSHKQTTIPRPHQPA